MLKEGVTESVYRVFIIIFVLLGLPGLPGTVRVDTCCPCI